MADSVMNSATFLCEFFAHGFSACFLCFLRTFFVRKNNAYVIMDLYGSDTK